MSRDTLVSLRRFADEKLAAFGLKKQGWSFRFDDAKVRYGCCHFKRREVTLSRALASLNPEEESRDTILHEIAHALAGPKAGHGPKWTAACAKVGARPERCYSREEVEQVEPRFWAECPSCGHRVGYHRRPRAGLACPKCCKEHNGGRYTERFALVLREAGTDRPAEPAPEASPRVPKYLGRCPVCGKEYAFYRRQNFKKACGACCEKHAGGRFDDRFLLQIYVRR